MASQRGEARSRRFDEGVQAEIPAQASGRKVNARYGSSGLPSMALMRSRPGRFQARRAVMNVELYDEEKDEVATEFDPPVTLRVPYNEQDVANAGGLEKLTLAFWDGTDWIPLNEPKHEFQLSGGEHGGMGSVKLHRWGDPPVGWG